LKKFEEAVSEIRKEWKRDLAKLEGEADSLKKQVPADKRKAVPVDVQALIAKRDALLGVERDRRMIRERHENTLKAIEEIKGRLATMKQELVEINEDFDALPDADTEALNKLTLSIGSVNNENAMANKAARLRDVQVFIKEQSDKVEEFDIDIDCIRNKRSDLAASAKLPVDNMTIEEDKICINGIPFEACSSAEQLEASIDVAMALDPPLKVCICQDASLLDADSMAVIERKAVDKDGNPVFQVFLEIVRDKKEVGVLFVDDGVAVSESVEINNDKRTDGEE
jgi:chromosome segregation ATPase